MEGSRICRRDTKQLVRENKIQDWRFSLLVVLYNNITWYVRGPVLFLMDISCLQYIVWKYNAEDDSVMQVGEKDYERCDRSEPIRGYKDGHTKIELKRSGPFYFISGEQGHCERGEKLLVVVLSPNHYRSYAAAPVNAPVSNVAAPVQAMVANRGSDHRLNRAWRLVATACMVLLIPLGLAV